ncbi:MAG TPA: hypothetical protein VFA38_05290 [Nitrospirales bacterium]|nr:hypothetical protein [Nitrospirales bacterium]
MTDTTEVAHELNNAINNIGLLVGNVAEQLTFESEPSISTFSQLRTALEQVSRAAALVRHLPSN